MKSPRNASFWHSHICTSLIVGVSALGCAVAEENHSVALSPGTSYEDREPSNELQAISQEAQEAVDEINPGEGQFLPVGDDTVDISNLPPGIRAVTKAEALEEDHAIVAKYRGWTIDDARAHYESGEAIGRVAEKLAKMRPEIFVGSILSENPTGRPKLLIKGRADKSLQDLLDEEVLNIELVEEQPFSAIENLDRLYQLRDDLKAAGFDKLNVTADITRQGKLLATVLDRPGASAKRDQLAQHLSPSVKNAKINFRADSIGKLTEAYGGLHVFTPGNGRCMSGWSMGYKTGSIWLPYGVSTAGHCTGISQIEHTSGTRYAFPFVIQHLGSFGDIERHTNYNSGTANDDFYALNSEIRDTGSVENVSSISVNESVCGFSRQQAKRRCYKVKFTSVLVFNNAIGVHMDQSFTIGGDSGGPWFYSTKAYGSTIGNSWVGGTFGDVWSKADHYNNALGNASSVMY